MDEPKATPNAMNMFRYAMNLPISYSPNIWFITSGEITLTAGHPNP